MKRVLILFVLSFVFANSYSQIYQKPLLFGKEENRLQVWNSLAIPSDTVILEAKKAYPAIAVKDGVLYTWNVSLQKWNPATGDSTNNNYPTSLSFNTSNGVVTLGRNGLSSLTVDLDGRYALNADVVHYSDSLTYYATQHDLDSVAKNLTTIINNIDSVQDNTTFSDGLHKVGNNVVALHDEANWNAYKFQGRLVSSATPLNGQVYAWDSVGLQWKPTTVAGGGTETDAIALAALADTAAAIRADIGSGGGSTPSLQDVLDVNPVANGNIQLDGSFYGSDFNAMNTGTLQSALTWDADGGLLTLKDAASGFAINLHALGGMTIDKYLYLPNGNDGDTLATQAWVRANAGGGGSTPTLQQVLTAGSVLTADASIGAASNTIYLQAGDFAAYTGAESEVSISNVGTTLIYAQNGTGKSSQITVDANILQLYYTNGTASTYLQMTDKVKLIGLPTYADESAATTAGLPSNSLYKTSTGELRIKL